MFDAPKLEDFFDEALDTSDACALAEQGLFIHDIDEDVFETPEDFWPGCEDLETTNPSPINQLINDPFMRG